MNKRKLISFVIPTKEYTEHLLDSIKIISSLNKTTLEISEIIIFELNRVTKNKYFDEINSLLKNKIDYKIFKTSEKIERIYLFDIKENINGIYTKLIHQKDFLIKESVDVLIEILITNTPDILYSNYLIYNNDSYEFMKNKKVSLNTLEGEIKGIPPKYNRSIYNYTFKTEFLKQIKYIDKSDKNITYYKLLYYVIAKASTFYSTDSFLYSYRIWPNRKLYEADIKSDDLIMLLINIIDIVNYDNPYTLEWTVKGIFKLSYLLKEYFLLNDKNYKIFNKEVNMLVNELRRTDFNKFIKIRYGFIYLLKNIYYFFAFKILRLKILRRRNIIKLVEEINLID